VSEGGLCVRGAAGPGGWLVGGLGAWVEGGWLVYRDVRQRSPYTRKSWYLWNWVASSLDRNGMTIVERGLCFSLSSETIIVYGRKCETTTNINIESEVRSKPYSPPHLGRSHEPLVTSYEMPRYRDRAPSAARTADPAYVNINTSSSLRPDLSCPRRDYPLKVLVCSADTL